MAADEQQPQDVVAIVRRRRAARPARPRHRRGRRSTPRPAAARCLALRRTASIAALRPTMISQAAGSRGGPFFGQVFERPQAGVLERLLGGVEIAEIAQQRADRLGARGGQRRVDPGHVGHCVSAAPRRAGTAADRPDLVGAAGIGLGRDRARSRAPLQRLAIDDVEAEQLLLGLGERPVDHQVARGPCAAWWRRWSASAARRARACRPWPASPGRRSSRAMTASSSSLVQEQTTSSAL